jgi:hypothetical protein
MEGDKNFGNILFLFFGVRVFDRKPGGFRSLMLRSGFKTQFPLRTAAISSRCVVGTKFVLDVASATPAAILNLRLARENFARSHDESSFETTSRHYHPVLLLQFAERPPQVEIKF